MKVLLVDDDATTLSVLTALLEDRGYDVIGRTEALGTSSAIAREQPDVAVVDVRMPGLGGDRLATLLVQNHPSLTVILHSSLPAADLERLARAAGAAGYVEKKADLGESVRSMVKIIDKLLPARAPRPRTK